MQTKDSQVCSVSYAPRFLTNVAQSGWFVMRFLNGPKVLLKDSRRHSKIYGNRCRTHSRLITSNKHIGLSQQRGVLRKLVRPSRSSLHMDSHPEFSGGRAPRPITGCYNSLGGVR